MTAAVALDPLLAYVDAVFDATRAWLDDVGTMALDTIPDTSRRLAEQGRPRASTMSAGSIACGPTSRCRGWCSGR